MNCVQINYYWPRAIPFLLKYFAVQYLYCFGKIFNFFTFPYNFTLFTLVSQVPKRFPVSIYFFRPSKPLLLKKIYPYLIFSLNRTLNYFFKNNFLFFILNNNYFFKSNLLLLTLSIRKICSVKILLSKIFKRTFGEGYLYIRGLVLIFFIDACITDDEPLWEPLEWSLVQTWIFFVFVFAWIAENLITSRFGSYTGRDKRVWFAWYKTFWLIEFWYLMTYLTASSFVIVPFYYEITYNISFVFSWWNWYTRVFLFKFLGSYAIILCIAYLLLLNVRWFNWKKNLLFILLINLFLAYTLYVHFIISFFGYFTNPLWYQKTRLIDHIQLSHEPLKWGWGTAKRDHFSYHKTSTVFWFKNDGPFAGSFLMIHLFLFLTLFFLYLYWIVLLRRIYITKETSYTLTVYCVSALRQFFYFFLLLYSMILISFLVAYWRFPIEFTWMVNTNSWVLNFICILKDYTSFFLF